MADFWTAFTASWPIWAFIVLMSAVAAYLIWACEHAPIDNTAPLSNLDRADGLTDLETCGMTDGDTFCRRPWDHADDFHADGFGRRWPVERAA